MNVSIFQNITSKQPLPGYLEGVANLIRSDEKLKVFTKSYRQTGSKTFKSECPLFISNGISQKLSAVNVGRAFSDLGFKRVRTNSSRGFIVVCRSAEEIKAYQHRLSADSQSDTVDDLPF